MEENSPMPLTPKEKSVLEFLETYIGRCGFSPSFQEVRNHFGFASFNSVQRYLKQLEKKNYIHVPGGNKKRAITLTNSSSAVQNSVVSMSEFKQSQPNPKDPKFSAPPREASVSFTEPLALPLLGKVAAGQPIEALTENEFVDVPASFVRNASKSYALQVQGDSMIEDGIHDGDVILVQEQSHASHGEIIVAVVENEATVKRFYSYSSLPNSAKDYVHWDGPCIELRPSNDQMDSMWYQPEQVEIRGVVVGLLRKYF